MATIVAREDDPNSNEDPLHNEDYVNHFRVSIFGSARTAEGHPYYQQIYDLSKAIGQQGYDVVTGGGPGLMEAANAGHQAGRKNQDTHSIGLTIQLPWENLPNRHLDLSQHFNRFSGRLDEFLALSNVAVFTHGGVGTCLEFFYLWQHIQVRHVTAFPMILLGSMWRGLIDWLKHHPLEKDLISPEDFDQVYVVETNEEAMEIIEAAHGQFLADGDVYRFEFDKYRAR